MPPSIVLASASPRRRELLARHGIPFTVDSSNVPEVPGAGESAEAFVRRAARDKALDVARRHSDAFVLAADTIVVVDGEVFGKPADADDARRMLRALSGRRHHVLTGVALVDTAGGLESLVVCSEVEFHALTADEVERYLGSGEPFDKAGAYAVQGIGGRFVASVRGSYSNVVGLPMDEVVALLRRRMGPGAVGAGEPA